MDPYEMRGPCERCGSSFGRIDERAGQDCIFCSCGAFQYNAPKTETGRAQRSLRSRPSIRPSKRTRILLRDNSTCVICHRADIDLQIGHLISVEVGRQIGLSEVDLYDDENLAAMCAECNSGLSDEPVSLRFLASALRARLAYLQNKGVAS